MKRLITALLGSWRKVGQARRESLDKPMPKAGQRRALTRLDDELRVRRYYLIL